MYMISFIIIGKNEGWKLSQCLESVYKTIISSKLTTYEVIYVDSNSSDDSIVRAQKFHPINIIKLTGDCNAAIARNSGAKESSGDILFFIDGDMEIQSNFLPLILNKNQSLTYPFISGQYVNYFYNSKNELMQKLNYDNSLSSGDQFKSVTGGLFIIETKYWNLLGGMKNKFKMGEDIDFGLRMSNKGIKLLRKKEVLAIHHTVSYKDNKRMWIMLLKSNAELYAKSLLYREHLININVYSRLIRHDYSLIVLVISIVLFFLIGYLSFLLFVSIVILRSIKTSKLNPSRIISFIGYFMLRDFLVLLGFFLFFPKKRFNIKYKII